MQRKETKISQVTEEEKNVNETISIRVDESFLKRSKKKQFDYYKSSAASSSVLETQWLN